MNKILSAVKHWLLSPSHVYRMMETDNKVLDYIKDYADDDFELRDRLINMYVRLRMEIEHDHQN